MSEIWKTQGDSTEMAQEIESIKPALSVILDDGDFIINSTGPIGKAMSQAILPLAAAAKKVTIITDGEMKVMKRNGTGQQAAAGKSPSAIGELVRLPAAQATTPTLPPYDDTPPDVQDQFAADLEAGVTGEAAMGEAPAPTPGPSDPVKIPAARRKPQIFQDAAAPPAPELAEAEMAQLLAEAERAEQDAAKVAEDQRFQRQQAVQAGQDQPDPATVDPAEAKPTPRKREPRVLATTGRTCGRCAGAGQIVGESGFQGACPVCHGEGQVKTWDRALKVR
jgi:hypothetical protein